MRQQPRLFMLTGNAAVAACQRSPALGANLNLLVQRIVIQRIRGTSITVVSSIPACGKQGTHKVTFWLLKKFEFR
jgi:hypothetical protein